MWLFFTSWWTGLPLLILLVKYWILSFSMTWFCLLYDKTILLLIFSNSLIYDWSVCFPFYYFIFQHSMTKNSCFFDQFAFNKISSQIMNIIYLLLLHECARSLHGTYLIYVSGYYVYSIAFGHLNITQTKFESYYKVNLISWKSSHLIFYLVLPF